MIYAVDFDGTLCKDEYPLIGAPNIEMIEFIKCARKQGNKAILWTCRSNEYLDKAVEWCKGYGLEFDAINSNLPELVDKFNNDCRKVYADIYIDDKAYGYGVI